MDIVNQLCRNSRGCVAKTDYQQYIGTTQNKSFFSEDAGNGQVLGQMANTSGL